MPFDAASLRTSILNVRMAEASRPVSGRAPRERFDPEPWRAELRGFVLRMGAGQDVDDVVQETFLRALRAPPQVRPRAWLHRVALNVLRDRVRRARPRGEEAAVAALETRSPDPGAAAIVRDTVRVAWEAATRLPDRQRAALILRIQRHLDYDEIAVVLECSVATARQHFHLAIRAVRDALAEENDD